MIINRKQKATVSISETPRSVVSKTPSWVNPGIEEDALLPDRVITSHFFEVYFRFNAGGE